LPRFAADPKSYLANIPEFKPVEKKPGPCGAEKVLRGLYCPDDLKDLVESELKDGACPTCGKKPEKVEYCVKTAPGQKTPDRARITYACAGCAATAEFEHAFKHEEGCKKKGSALKKVCSKSGTPPHETLPK
jgi:hypothetical protein